MYSLLKLLEIQFYQILSIIQQGIRARATQLPFLSLFILPLFSCIPKSLCKPFIELSSICLKWQITNHVNPAFEKWMDRDISVRAWLDSRISEELLPYTVGAYSSHALWMILEKQFVGASSCHFDLGVY